MPVSVAMRDRIKAAIPKPVMWLGRAFELVGSYSYDFFRYLRYSSSVGVDTSRANHAAWITMLYHNIEKGLSLPQPRPCFGAERVQRLVENLEVYMARYGEDEVVIFALSALTAYVDFNRAAGVASREIPSFGRISDLLADREFQPGGSLPVAKTDVLRSVAGVQLDFFLSRSSVRQFAPGPISDQAINFAVRAAQAAPAVCNRQFSRVYVTQDPVLIEQALAIQGGARGFASQVPGLAVVVASLRNYWNPGERMQAWTDGGLFAMSFVLGLHSRGIGSVCLNWSKTPDVDRSFRAAFALEDHEVVLMLVAFGNLNDEYRVAASPRVPLSSSLQTLSRKEGSL